jgi:molybdenum cofactor biosynthesis enzyme
MSTPAPTLSHLDEAGQVRMVDVIGKTDTERVAIATASVRMNAVAYGLLTQPGQGKGEVLNTCRCRSSASNSRWTTRRTASTSWPPAAPATRPASKWKP